MLKNVVRRLLLGTMIPVSFITFIPNIMLSDPGTEQSKIAAYIGIGASSTLFLGGVAGIFHHPVYMPIKMSYRLGILGLVLQVGALTIASFRRTKDDNDDDD